MAKGTATIDFGASPGGNTTSLAITGQTAILTTSFVEAFIMGDSTADHNVDEHLLAPFRLECRRRPLDSLFTRPLTWS